VSYRTLVVGTDGSERANRAVDRAADLAHRFDARLIVATASAPVGLTDHVAEDVLELGREVALRRGVKAETAFREGDPQVVIASVAEDEGADLIVVGNRGMGRVHRLRLGAIAERVARLAPSDVLIADTREDRPASEEVYPKILVGTDGSPTATDAAGRAFTLGMSLGVGVVVVCVTDDDLVGAITLEDTVKLRPRALGVTTKLVRGDPAQRLADVAEEEGAGLIVVGNRGMAGARRVLLGSVPSKVANIAPVDVLVMRTVGKTLADLGPGQGGVVTIDGRKVAVFVEEDGARRALNPRCSHMGCTVGWNAAERTWDCPCHGSRYALDGEVVQGPAKKPLDPEELPA